MALATRKKSTGKAGEEAAQYWFHRHGWHMQKLEPPVRNKGQIAPGVFRAVYVSSGQPDYIGYVDYGDGIPFFRAVEAKEALRENVNSMPASRLDKAQRAHMADLPEGCAFVGILWRDGTFELFPFVERGSYRRGEGQT